MTPVVTVAHLVETPGPGGAETVLVELVRRTDPARYRSLAIFPSDEGWLGRTIPAAARIAGPSSHADSGPLDLRYLRAIRALVSRERPALLHAHSFDSAFYGALAIRGRPVRLLATFHGAADFARYGWRNRVKWFALRRAEAIVCVSHALARLARDVPGPRRERIEVIHNGIDVESFKPARGRALRERLGIPDATVLLGAVGNVRAPKGYDVLLHAVALARRGGVQLHLVIAGDDAGPLAASLRELRDSLRLGDCVTFVGFRDDVPSFLNDLDLFVLPSLSEGFSLSTAQALATALPVIATRSGGPEEIVEDGVSGMLIEPGSPAALADAIVGLVADPIRRERLARAGRERVVSAFSVDSMVRRYESLYDAVLAR